MSSQQENRFVLAAVEKHLVESQGHISRMRELVADGERQGFDMTEPRKLLARFLVAHVKREARRELLLAQLDKPTQK